VAMPRPLPVPALPRPLLLRRAAPAVLVAVLALTACGTDDETDTAVAAPTVTATTAPPEAPAEPQPAATPSPDDAQVIAITVSGGEVSGAEPRTVVPVGTQVRLSVTTDAVDELHVHGYELTQRVSAGETATVEFLADRPGLYEVEFHDSQRVLTRLQVQ
jgi:heme/copper-type cytochrome/quinol oxidase subunit 2